MEEGPNAGKRTGGQEPLRDWQKDDTWYGPFPAHENPFDEPEDAPELREMRSEELNNRSGQFWDTWTGGYQYTDGKQAAPAERPKEKQKKTASPRRKGLLVLAALLAAAVIGAVLNFGVFVVREIHVTGAAQIPENEIIRLSGIRKGMPMLGLDQDEIERAIEKNPYVKYRYLEKRWPGTVILSVREREACCWMTWNGILYAMDKQRVVLFETEDLTIRPSTLVRVDGLKIRSGALTGQRLVLESQEQQEVFSALFLEMKVLSCTELVEEADLSNINSLLLTTRDGFTVSMGDRQNIHAKLRSMLLTREELLKRGYHGGVINVSLPETPVFSPPAV